MCIHDVITGTAYAFGSESQFLCKFTLIYLCTLSYFAVVNQRYEPEVQNPAGFLHGNVLIKCNIPSFVKEYVSVTSWLQEPSFNIYPSLEGGECS